MMNRRRTPGIAAKVPNLLINGAGGIAVGYATNIPTHNLGEVVAALLHVLENPAASLTELMNLIPGRIFPRPDSFTGLKASGRYEHGRGLLTLRANTHVETDDKRDRASIIVTEIPYQVNKAKLLEKIAELVQEKRLEGISDIRDESDRDGIRVVIELKKARSHSSS